MSVCVKRVPERLERVPAQTNISAQRFVGLPEYNDKWQKFRLTTAIPVSSLSSFVCSSSVRLSRDALLDMNVCADVNTGAPKSCVFPSPELIHEHRLIDSQSACMFYCVMCPKYLVQPDSRVLEDLPSLVMLSPVRRGLECIRREPYRLYSVKRKLAAVSKRYMRIIQHTQHVLVHLVLKDQAHEAPTATPMANSSIRMTQKPSFY